MLTLKCGNCGNEEDFIWENTDKKDLIISCSICKNSVILNYTHDIAGGVDGNRHG